MFEIFEEKILSPSANFGSIKTRYNGQVREEISIFIGINI